MALFTLVPSIILIAVFVYGFIGSTVYSSFTDRSGGAGLAENPVIKFIGLQNYAELFTGIIRNSFRQSLVNAFFYSILLVLGTIVVGVVLAMLLDQAARGENIFRTAFLYPLSLSFIVSGTIWRWLLAPSGGINVLPGLVGLRKSEFLWISSRDSILNFNWQSLPRMIAIVLAAVLIIRAVWLWRNRRTRGAAGSRGLDWKVGRPLVIAGVALLYAIVLHPVFPKILPYEEEHGFNLATLGVIMAAVWQYSGYTMALYLAGFRGISPALRDAARVDGLGEFRYYMQIALPNVWPITLSAVVILAHISLKMFDLIFAIAGTDNSSVTHPSVFMYLTTFRGNNFALGAASAVVLFIFAALLIIPYLINSYRTSRGLQ